MQRSVSGEEDAHAVGLNDPTAPQRFVAIADPARAEMLRRGAGGAECWCLEGLPPVALDDRANAKRVQQFTQSERTEPRRVREPVGDAADGRRIEMVVVIVREQDNVEWRERV